MYASLARASQNMCIPHRVCLCLGAVPGGACEMSGHELEMYGLFAAAASTSTLEGFYEDLAPSTSPGPCPGLQSTSRRRVQQTVRA